MKKLLNLIATIFLSTLLYAQPGTIDPSFGDLVKRYGTVYGITSQLDGKVFIYGNFSSTVNGVNKIYGPPRLNTDGSLDTSFVLPYKGFDNAVSKVVVQSDGKILMGGMFQKISGAPATESIPARLIRLYPDGSMDTTFNKNLGTGFTVLNEKVMSLVVQEDGKIIVVGKFTGFNGNTHNRILRLNAEGTLDATYNVGTGFNGGVGTIILQSDGKVIVGGGDIGGNPGDGFSSFNGQACANIARLNTDGTFDATFNAGGSGIDLKYNYVKTLAIQQDGKILVGGVFSQYNGQSANGIVRLNIDGSRDTTFKIGNGFETQNQVRAIAVQHNNKILVGGLFKKYDGDTTIKFIARLNVDGSVDKSFETGKGFSMGGIVGGAYLYDLSIQDDGKIFAGGNFDNYNDTIRYFVLRLNGDDDIRTEPITLSENCTEPNVTVSFKANAKFENSNIFTAQLSDENGSFNSPLVIGTLTGTGSGTINANIPLSVRSGNKYRIRVVSDNPVIIGDDNGVDLTINHIESAVINVDGYKLSTTLSYDNYQWLLDENIIQGATDSAYIVLENGDYKVVVSEITTGCIDTSDVYRVTSIGVGISNVENIANQITVYPNPTSDILAIHSPIAVDVTITGIEGKIIGKEKSVKHISLKGLAAGVYLLHITDKMGNQIKVTKIVKSK